jgi:hypothetical protein
MWIQFNTVADDEGFFIDGNVTDFALSILTGWATSLQMRMKRYGLF